MNDNIPTDFLSQEEVLKLALTNPIIAACVATYRHGKLSWHAALTLMVVTLAKDNEGKDKVIKELAPFAPPKPIVVGPIEYHIKDESA